MSCFRKLSGVLVVLLSLSISGCSTSDPDATPPATITDLECISTTLTTATLTWTAPGDDGMVGPVYQYDLRYSTRQLSDTDWSKAPKVTENKWEPEPGRAGTKQTYVASGLFEEMRHYFALRAADEEFNWSDFSNIAAAQTGEGTVKQITTAGGMFPTWSPDGSLIAFQSERDGNSDIWIIPSNGGVATKLTDDSGSDLQPCWSPDGNSIAFSSNRGGSYDIWIIPEAGGTPSRVTADFGSDQDPYFSPDGSMIAFVSDRSGNLDIWTIPSTGGTATRITTTDHDESAPTWSVNDQIAYRLYDPPPWPDPPTHESGIWVIPATGGVASVLVEWDESYSPDWSPDGSVIAYHREGAIWVGDAPITPDTDPGPSDGPAWSLLGDKIAFHSDRAGTTEIWTIEINQ